MIECLKIEDFVITNMFFPYMENIISEENESIKYKEKAYAIMRKLTFNPVYIIDILEKNPKAKQRVFDRLRKFGGVKFYRYLDMSNPVIRYVKEGLEETNEDYSTT